MALSKKKQITNNWINQSENIRQKFLRYGVIVAEAARDSFIVGGRKGLAKFELRVLSKLK